MWPGRAPGRHGLDLSPPPLRWAPRGSVRGRHSGPPVKVSAGSFSACQSGGGGAAPEPSLPHRWTAVQDRLIGDPHPWASAAASDGQLRWLEKAVRCSDGSPGMVAATPSLHWGPRWPLKMRDREGIYAAAPRRPNARVVPPCLHTVGTPPRVGLSPPAASVGPHRSVPVATYK